VLLTSVAQRTDSYNQRHVTTITLMDEPERIGLPRNILLKNQKVSHEYKSPKNTQEGRFFKYSLTLPEAVTIKAPPLFFV